MHHHELDAVVMVDGGMTGVEPRAAGAAGQDKYRNNERKKFHGGRQYTLEVMQQCNVSPRDDPVRAAILNKLEQLAP